MITGDHALTASAIGAATRLRGGPALTGRDLDRLDDEALRSAVHDIDIFARTTPEHKLRLVRALQADGATIAMTGDGVNDAPALKRADVGMAMGNKGTEAAREAAAMVLADDNFVSIAAAVAEGRTVYDNLRKTILFLLPTNAAQAMIILLAILAGTTLPITPVQILWVNMISAVTLGLALAFEPPEPDIMRRPPRRPGEGILTGYMAWRILSCHGVADDPPAFSLFLWLESTGASVAEARTIAVNTLVVGEIFYLWNARAIMNPVLSFKGIFGSRPVLISMALCLLLQLGFTYLPFMHRPVRHGRHRLERLGGAGGHRCGGLRDHRTGEGGGPAVEGLSYQCWAVAQHHGSERLDDHEDHDADHQQGRHFVHDAEEALGLPVAVLGKRAAPAGHHHMGAGQADHEGQLGVNPAHLEPARIQHQQRDAEDPGRYHRRVHDGTQQPALHHLEGFRSFRTDRDVAVVDEQPRQIQQPRHPGDDADDVKRLDPVVKQSDPSLFSRHGTFGLRRWGRLPSGCLSSPLRAALEGVRANPPS